MKVILFFGILFIWQNSALPSPFSSGGDPQLSGDPNLEQSNGMDPNLSVHDPMQDARRQISLNPDTPHHFVLNEKVILEACSNSSKQATYKVKSLSGQYCEVQNNEILKVEKWTFEPDLENSKSGTDKISFRSKNCRFTFSVSNDPKADLNLGNGACIDSRNPKIQSVQKANRHPPSRDVR